MFKMSYASLLIRIEIFYTQKYAFVSSGYWEKINFELRNGKTFS